MKRWIDFTDRIGSDGTILVDGRLSMDSIHRKAQEIAQQMRFILSSDDTRMYQIVQGTKLISAKPISEVRTVTVDRSKD